MITGTSDYQHLFQGLLTEMAIVDGQPFGLQIVKLSDDSHVPFYIASGSIFATISPVYVISGTIAVNSNGLISTGNSTYANLGANGAFSGSVESVVEYASIIITTKANVASATNGLKFLFSPDGVNFTVSDNYTISANACKTYSVQPVGPYFRVVYVNGATPQTSFALCTQYKKAGGVDRSHRVEDDISGQDDADLTKAIIAAERPGNAGIYTNVQATNGGNLKISLEEVNGVVVPSYIVSGTVNVQNNSSAPITVARGDNWLEDPFQRDRVSLADKRFDFDFHAGKNIFIWDEVGNGAVTFVTGSRDVVVSITGTSTANYQSLIQHAVNPYTALSGQLISETGVINNGNLTGTARCFLRSSVTGATTEEYVYPASGTIDWSKSQIFLMDFQSLRVGRIRFALDRDGEVYELGEISNDNKRQTGYWQTANHPIHYRVYNTTGSTISEIAYGDEFNGIGFQYVTSLNASQSCRMICAGVRSEGGGDLLSIPGQPFVAPPTTAPFVASRSVTNAILPILSIRVSQFYNGMTNRTIVIPKSYSIQTSNPIDYAIIYRPTLTNASWQSIANSGVEYDISATALSGGTEIEGDNLSSGNNQVAKTTNLLGKIVMALGYTGTSDILTIAAIRTSSTDASVRAKMKWEEIR